MIVIDTHVLIWLTLEPTRLTPTAKQSITNANQTDGIIIADMTLWEIAMLVGKGRIALPTTCENFLELAIQAYDLQVQSITPQIATLATQLPKSINKDPSDRLIVATALAENVPLVTADRNLRAATVVSTIW